MCSYSFSAPIALTSLGLGGLLNRIAKCSSGTIMKQFLKGRHSTINKWIYLLIDPWTRVMGSEYCGRILIKTS